MPVSAHNGKRPPVARLDMTIVSGEMMNRMQSHETELGLTRARIAELRSRVAEIAERNRKLTQRPLEAGSSGHDLESAREHAELARTRAVQAHERAAQAYLRSAAVHEAVADRYETIAAEGYGDPGECRRLAREHRQLSAEDLKAGNATRGFLHDDV